MRRELRHRVALVERLERAAIREALRPLDQADLGEVVLARAAAACPVDRRASVKARVQALIQERGTLLEARRRPVERRWRRMPEDFGCTREMRRARLRQAPEAES
jgi:hypothetical protein